MSKQEDDVTKFVKRAEEEAERIAEERLHKPTHRKFLYSVEYSGKAIVPVLTTLEEGQNEADAVLAEELEQMVPGSVTSFHVLSVEEEQ